MKPALRIATIALIALGLCAPAFAEDGASIYKAKCQMCHGATGMGDTPAGKAMKVPAFKGAKVTEADMLTTMTNGKGKMPAYKGKLSDADIKAVIAYVHTLEK